MSTHNPVLLLHGRISSHLQMGKLADYLSHLGWCTHSFSLEPRTGELGLEHWVRQIGNYMTRNFSPEQPVDLVGFSSGYFTSPAEIHRCIPHLKT
jgi:triacylglycerol lipase